MNVKEWLGKDNVIGYDIWTKKYQYNNETFSEWLNRVTDSNEDYKQLIIEKKFLPGGRILANRGLYKDGTKVTYSNCFVAGSKVATKRGLINIEDIVIGDEVIGEDNQFHKVNNTLSRNYDGALYKISSESLNEPIICTPNHQFLTERGWIPADKLNITNSHQKLDRLSIINYHINNTYEKIDLIKYIDLNKYKYEEQDGYIQTYIEFPNPKNANKVAINKKSNKFKRYMSLTPEFCYFIGRWLGDGSVTFNDSGQGIIQIVFNATTENDAAKYIENIGNEFFGIKAQVKTTRQNVIAVRWNCLTIARFFKEEFGQYCDGKNLKRKYIGDFNIIRGLLDADGCVLSNGSFKLLLKNKKLIEQIHEGLILNGIPNKYYQYERQENSYQLNISADISRLKLNPYLNKKYADERMTKTTKNTVRYGNYIHIKGIEILNNQHTTVYNLSVEDVHSYNIQGIVVHNCYVIPSPEDNIESIFDTAAKMARTFSYGGGVGIDISKLAPSGAKVNNTAKHTSGATSFMDLYSLVTGLIGQNGRRGALMISLACDHPDVENFITLKSDLNRVTKANISVRVTDKFMQAVENDSDFKLHFERAETGEVIEKTVKARNLFHKLCEMNWDYAEPGILFWDTICNYNLLSEDSNFHYDGVNP